MAWKLNKLKNGQPLQAFCLTHGRNCCVGVEASTSGQKSVRVEAAGPTCCPFSFAGKRKQVLQGLEY